jgi:hypothetical protein
MNGSSTILAGQAEVANFHVFYTVDITADENIVKLQIPIGDRIQSASRRWVVDGYCQS